MEVYRLREKDHTIHRLAVPQLPMVAGLCRGYDGRYRGGRVEHTTGHGLLYPWQRRTHRRAVHGRVPRAGVLSARHVPSHITGRAFRPVPDDRQSGDHVRYRRRRGRPYTWRLHGHPGGDRRHFGGRACTAAHVRVSTWVAVHRAVGDAGQRLHRVRGRHRVHFTAEGVAGRGRGSAARHDAGTEHVLRLLRPFPHHQLGDHHGVRHHCHHPVGVQQVPEGEDQQQVVYATANRTDHHSLRHSAVPSDHDRSGLSHGPGKHRLADAIRTMAV